MSSKIKGLPPRIQIRRWDDQQGSYPNSKRQDIFENYKSNVFFDDSQTINFGSYDDIHFPNALISGSYFDDNLGSTIVTRGNQRSGISDSRIFQTLQVQSYEPYNESKLIIDDSDFAMTGTNLGFLPGWNSRLGSKISINIPMRNEKRKNLTKIPSQSIVSWAGFSASDYGGTGFCYYNFSRNAWDDIGPTDALGKPTGYSGAFRGDSIFSGSNVVSNSLDLYYTLLTSSVKYLDLYPIKKNTPWPQQFYFGGVDSSAAQEYRIQGYTDSETYNFSARNVGSPVDTFGAPGDPIYFATSSQTFDLSSRIGFPFLLEKATLKIPLSIKIPGSSWSCTEANWIPDPGPGENDYTASRYFFRVNRVDPGVRVINFFLYRQRRLKSKDPLQEISGSSRTLIMSGCFAVYNTMTQKKRASNTQYTSFNLSYNVPYPDVPSHAPITGQASEEDKRLYNPPWTPGTSVDLDAPINAYLETYGPFPDQQGGRFYNPWNGSYYDLASGSLLSGGPYYTGSNALDRSFSEISTGSVGSYVVSGTFSINMIPATCPAGFKGVQTFGLENESGSVGGPMSSPAIGMYWSGGYTKNLSKRFLYGADLNCAYFADLSGSVYVTPFYDSPKGVYTRESDILAIDDAQNGISASFFGLDADYYNYPLPEFTVKTRDVSPDTRFLRGTIPAGSGDRSIKGLFATYQPRYISYVFDETDEVVFRSSNPPAADPLISPYLLLPGDELVLGLEIPTADTRTMVFTTGGIRADSLASSSIAIGEGEMDFTLYGSIPRQNLPIEYSLNQVLTADSIHEGLHSDNPVTDQFDVDVLADYSGSYIAEIFRGDILPGDGFINGRDKNRRAFYSAFDANRSPSRFGISGPDGATGTDLYYQPYDLVSGSFLRAVKMSSGERVWDSVTPDPVDYLRSAFDITVGSTGSYVDFYDFSGSLREPTAGYEGSWYNSGTYRARYFPFEAGLERGKSNNPRRGTEAVIFGSSLLGSTATGYSDEYKRIIAFSRGWDLRYTSTQGTPIAFSPWQGARALRYGLSNYRAQFTAAHFRRDHHGFVRDMLEQRPFTAFQTFGGFTDPAVSAIFVSASSETQVDPLLTNCSNVSAHATSSVPYFDGQFRNRLSFPTASLLPEFKPTLILG